VTTRKSDGLQERRVLVVEDDYLIASSLAGTLETHGAEVIGPAASVQEALQLMAGEARLDAAVLDVNLAGDRVYRVADALLARDVPFAFATGYDAWIIPDVYAGVPRMEKPVDPEALIRTLAAEVARRA